jgi:rhodanese-related sulfurtransferase
MRRLASLTLVVFTSLVALDAAAQKINPKDPATVMRVTQLGFQPLQAEGKVLVLDVRTPQLFGEGHIPGAINVPLPDVEKRADEIKEKAAGRPIVAYCSCPAEHSAAEAGLILYKRGVSDVRVLLGGYPDWVHSGGKVEKGS